MTFNGFSTTLGVTEGMYSLILGGGVGGAGPNYAGQWGSTASTALTYALANSSSVSLDVYVPAGDFGYYLQWDLALNQSGAGGLGYQSVDGYSYQAANIGGEKTLTWTVPPAMKATLAANPTLPTSLNFQIGGGYTSASDAVYLDHLVVTDPLSWTDLTGGPVVSLFGEWGQFVPNSQLPAGNAAFFRLIQRQYTQLLVLWPGETLAPNTANGKTGTPTPVSVNTVVNFTVYAVDATWHIVPVSGDFVSITSSDSAATLPNNLPLNNGTLAEQIMFGTTGGQTVTAADITNPSILTNMSSTITVQGLVLSARAGNR